MSTLQQAVTTFSPASGSRSSECRATRRRRRTWCTATAQGELRCVRAVNPNSTEVEGDACYADLKSVPAVRGSNDLTTPLVADDVVHECAELGIDRVWMHRSFGKGSVSPAAEAFCRERGIAVIAGGCPTCSSPHRRRPQVHAWMLKLTGGLPKG